jgi:hypothetical protein
MYRIQHFYRLLNASWKQCSVSVFRTACDSASTTSTVSNSFVFDRGNRGKWDGWVMTVMLFFVENSLVERKVEVGALS